MQKYKRKISIGFTLVETLVALAIFTLGMQATVLVFAKTIKNKAYTMEMGKASFIISRSMGDLIGYIRRARQSDDGAFPIISADENDFVLYSDYDKDGITEKLEIQLDYTTDIVKLTTCKPTSTVPKRYDCLGGSVKIIELAKNIINTPSEPMFSYYNKDYPLDTVNNPISGTVDVSQIRLVKILLKINIDPNRPQDNITQESFVEMRNLNDYDRIY